MKNKQLLFIFMIVLAACSQPAAQVVQDPQQPCRYVENVVELYHVDEDRISGPYIVVDCLQLPDVTNWEEPETSGEVVEVIGTDIRHDGVARPADNIIVQDVQWLNVIVQHEQIRPYALNLQIPSMPNVIVNPSFEEGQTPWQFHSDAGATFALGEPGYTDNYAANISVPAEDSNLQLYQFNLPLEPNTQYKLTLSAWSNTGHNLSIILHKHVSPYTNYGLGNYVFDLTSSWQEFSVDFVTTGFDVSISDARLRFWFTPFATDGDVYWIDNIVLSKVEEQTPVPPTDTLVPPTETLISPTETPTPTQTSTITPTSTSTVTLTPTLTLTPTPTPTPTHTHQDLLDRIAAIETQQAEILNEQLIIRTRVIALSELLVEIASLITSNLGE